MNGRAYNQVDVRRAIDGASAMRVLQAQRRWMMPPRPEWNAIGPRLPLWFTKRLKRIDAQLTLQYMPPRSSRHPDGVDPTLLPSGAWVICRRMPRTGWLFKQWVYSLADAKGNTVMPTMDLLKMINMAYRLWRRGKGTEMERMLDDAISNTRRDQAEKSRAPLIRYIERLMRHFGFTDGGPRVFLSSRYTGAITGAA